MKEKLLFLHNSMAEYRIGFWEKLNELIDLDLLITNKGLEKKIYNIDIGGSNLKYSYLNKNTFNNVNFQEYKAIILSPADTVREFLIDYFFQKKIKKESIECVYWCEKWEAPWNLQPIVKKIKNLVHRGMIGYLCRNSDKCIASGTKSAEYLERLGINKNKIFIAYDSSTSPNNEVINIRKKYGIANNQKIILYMGRLISRKGCDLLIDAVKPILKKYNCTLLICGDGDLKENYMNKAKGYDIKFAGLVNPSERRSFYEQSDIFVLPSICEYGTVEAWGLTVNEALECGTPVLATQYVGSAHDLLNDKNGLILTDVTSETIREAITVMLSYSYNRKIISNLEKNYSIDNMAASFRKAIE